MALVGLTTRATFVPPPRKKRTIIMSSNSSKSHPEILEALPEPLHSMKRFLLWKQGPHPKDPKKTTKTPYYLNGKKRYGVLDTENDLNQLVTLEEALDEYLLGDYAGIGFALSGDGVGAFDLDWVLNDDGDLIEAHAGYDLALKAKELGCYIELSPSGKGLRIVGPCDTGPAYSKNGLEFWSQKRFVTLTGDVWANPKGWVGLKTLREAYGTVPEAPKSAQDYEDEEVGIITPLVIETLRDALKSIPADDRVRWVNVGLALKTIGPKGRELWMEWSANCPEKYDRADAARVWASFHPTKTNYKHVFVEAQDNWDWQNPARRDYTADDDESSALPSPRSFEVPLGNMVLHPTEFILDGFLPVGVTVIAGAWGAGKSTNLIPLLCSVAHLAPEEWGFWPTIRRKVIWITEAPEQTRDTLFSIAKAEDSAPWDEIKEWFRVFRSYRHPPKKLAKLVRQLIEETTYSLDNGFQVNPVIVLDTTAANIEIDNESDNSMVSQAMATLKQALPGISVVLVGHTPKALVKADVGDMTFRGAGAWEADAAATYFLIHDAETDTRFLAIRKCRFTPTFREIDFSHESGSQIVDTPWGDPQSKSYLHGVPTKSDGAQRKAAQAEIKEAKREEAKERTLSDRQQRIMDVVQTRMDTDPVITKAQVLSWVGGKKELVFEAIDRLVERGSLERHRIGREHFPAGLKGPTPEVLLPAGVEIGLILNREPVE